MDKFTDSQIEIFTRQLAITKQPPIDGHGDQSFNSHIANNNRMLHNFNLIPQHSLHLV